jgi:septum formation protein
VQATEFLRQLSASEHRVLTAVCLKKDQNQKSFSVSTRVLFRSLSDDEIKAYVDSGEPMDKAGAYAIQGGAAHMVKALFGSYTNVVGLPLCELRQVLLEEFG